MPKLIFVVTEDWYFVSHRLPLAVAARDAGYDVVVACRVTDAADPITAAGLRVVDVPFARSGLNPVHDWTTVRALAALYRSEKPDIVHHVALKPVIYGSLAARRVGGPKVVNALAGLGYVFSSDALKARVLRPVVRRLLRTALRTPNAHLIVQNRDDFETFVSEGLVDRSSVRLIRGAGVDPATYPLGDPIGDGPPTVVLPARFLRDKGILEFVDAAKMLTARGIEARFVLCGEPDPSNPASFTTADIDAFVHEGVVENWGWHSDMRQVWAKAQIGCLPSYREGLPKALLEAAASGLPLVATDVPGCREVCKPGENGWLVPARDAAALADALATAIGDAELRAAYGRASRTLIEQELSLTRVIDETLATYRTALGA